MPDWFSLVVLACGLSILAASAFQLWEYVRFRRARPMWIWSHGAEEQRRLITERAQKIRDTEERHHQSSKVDGKLSAQEPEPETPSNREEMMVQNLPLVAFVVHKMVDQTGDRTLDREDAFSYGVEGLIKAVDTYRASTTSTFASYAIRHIRSSILDATRRMTQLSETERARYQMQKHSSTDLSSKLDQLPVIDDVDTPRSREEISRLYEEVKSLLRSAG